MAPSIEWHPRRLARPTEWTIRVPGQPEPIALVRLLHLRGRPTYRAVTWAPSSAGRELVGYFPSGDAAAVAVWRKYVDDTARHDDRAARASVPPGRGSGRGRSDR